MVPMAPLPPTPPAPLPVMPPLTPTTPMTPMPSGVAGVWPMTALPYNDMYSRRSRPGIITAMGVMSIVVACISGLFNLWAGMMGLGFLWMSQMRMPPAPAASVAMATTSPLNLPAGGGTVTVGGIPMRPEETDDGLTEPQRRVIVVTLTRLGGLDEQRQKHLDLLLAVSGQKVFPFATSPGLTMTKVRSNVTEKGTLPSARGGNGPDYFIVGTGRLECYDDHAVFRPDGSTDVVSATATSGEENGTATASGSESQGTNAAPASPGPAGSPGVTSRTQVTTVGPGGRMTTVTTSGGGGPPFKVNPIAAGATIVEAMASVALAIYLLVIGILVLRDSRSGRKLHWVFVGLKIPLVIVGAVAAWYLWTSLYQSMSAAMAASAPPGTPRPPAVPGFMGVGTAVAALMALAYPVALIFVLNSRTVREYYGSIRE